MSTTHSVVGAIVGFGVATYGTESVKWGMDGIGKIVISWVTAPLSAGVIAAVLFFLVCTPSLADLRTAKSKAKRSKAKQNRKPRAHSKRHVAIEPIENAYWVTSRD